MSNRSEYAATGSPGRDRSFGVLVSILGANATALVRQEVALARAEIREKAREAGSALAAFAIGALVLFAGGLVLLDAAVYALQTLLPPGLGAWASSLIVGLLVAAAGAALLHHGRSRLAAHRLLPERTARSLGGTRTTTKEERT